MKKLTSLLSIFENKRKTRLLKLCTATFLVIIATIVCVFTITDSPKADSSLSENIIRLHVLANSDSPEDQELKRKVRDVIIENMKVMLEGSKDIGQTRNIIQNNLTAIEKIAEDEIRNNGKDYKVSVMLGNYVFPTRMYGDITLPSGNYEALRVVIGNGEGQNWWCVLFPPLCFIDATHGTVPDSLKQDLKAILAEEDYKLITSDQSWDELPVKIKFKLVEIFQNSKYKVLSRISRLFD